MCAARVLSDHFERVTLIERDDLPEGAAHRKGVPQSRHPHGLLDRGRSELNALFPGLDASLHERGGLDMDTALELATLNPDGWAARRRTGHQMLFASRLLIESVIRDRIRKNPRITIVEGTEVTALVSAPGDTSRVTGVETRKVGDRSMSRIEADLVVDCSGRSSRASEWLTALGYPEVEVEVVDRQDAAGLETSFANGGQISASHNEPWANPAMLRKAFGWLGHEDAPMLLRWRPISPVSASAMSMLRLI